jgi:hypothetical protein
MTMAHGLFGFPNSDLPCAHAKGDDGCPSFVCERNLGSRGSGRGYPGCHCRLRAARRHRDAVSRGVQRACGRRGAHGHGGPRGRPYPGRGGGPSGETNKALQAAGSVVPRQKRPWHCASVGIAIVCARDGRNVDALASASGDHQAAVIYSARREAPDLSEVISAPSVDSLLKAPWLSGLPCNSLPVTARVFRMSRGGQHAFR